MKEKHTKKVKKAEKKTDKKRVKVPKGLQYLRYRNLNQELAQFGYDYTPKKAMASYGVVLLLALILSMLYKLSPPYLLAVGIIGIVFLPFLILQTMKGRYHTDMFDVSNTYMDQFLHSFNRTRTVLHTLEEVVSIFSEGRFRSVIEDAISHIQYSIESEDAEKEALDMIGDYFHCEKVDAIHGFALSAQRRGGNVDKSIEVFSNNRALWVERIKHLQKEYLTVKRNVIIALIATALICIFPLYILGSGMDISGSAICQTTAVLLLASCMGVYVKADKKLCQSWIEKSNEMKHMDKKYLQVKGFDEAKERKKSEKMAIIPALLFLGLFVYMQELWVLVCGIVVTWFFLQQHKVGYNLAKRSVKKELGIKFPAWLMDIGFLLQTENVQVALRKSEENVSEVMFHPLADLIEELEVSPNAIEPYHNFLKEYRNPEIQSTMKILYSLSNGQGGDSEAQINELIRRNNLMVDQAEKLVQEDKIASMKGYVLFPSLLASFKLMIDMGILLVVFLENLAV